MKSMVAALLGLALLLCGAGTGAQAAGRGADGDFDTRTSAHFLLLQDVAIDESGGFYGSRRFEQQVLDVLESAFEHLDDRLGLRPARRIKVVVYDDAVFEAQFRGLFRFSAAGFYNGAIAVRAHAQVDEALRRVLRHELVHAALDMAAPSLTLPAWLNEGLAEWFEVRESGQRQLQGWQRGALAAASKQGHLFSLASLSSPSYGHLGPGAASLAYLQSYGFVSYLAKQHGESTLPRLVRELFSTKNLDRSVRRVFRADLATLEKRFLATLR